MVGPIVSPAIQTGQTTPSNIQTNSQATNTNNLQPADLDPAQDDVQVRQAPLAQTQETQTDDLSTTSTEVTTLANAAPDADTGPPPVTESRGELVDVLV